MAMTASTGGGGMDFPECPAGPHPARCYKLVDIGTQPSERYDPKRQILLGFEVPGQMIEYEKDGEAISVPQGVSKFLTLSMHEKSTLRQIVQTWLGKAMTDAEAEEFDLTTLLGKTAYINVIHKANGKANIASVMALPEGLPIEDQMNDTVYYSIDEHGLEWPDCMSEKMIAWVSKSKEIKLLHGDKAIEKSLEPENVPF